MESGQYFHSRKWLIFVLFIALILIINVTAIIFQPEKHIESGGTWNYQYTRILDDLTFVGHMRITFIGATTATLFGEDYKALCYKAEIHANLSIPALRMSVWERGTLSSLTYDYYDIQTEREIGTLSYQNMSLTPSNYYDYILFHPRQSYETQYYSEKNETLLIPPGGNITTPLFILNGTNWAIEYSEKYQASVLINNVTVMQPHGTNQYTLQFVYKEENITDIGTGDLTYQVIDTYYPGQFKITSWECKDTVEPIKIVATEGSETTMICTLEDYDFSFETTLLDPPFSNILLTAVSSAIFFGAAFLSGAIRKKNSRDRSLPPHNS